MKRLLVLIGFLATSFCLVTAKLPCKSVLEAKEEPNWNEMVANCTKLMRDQIQMEIFASMNYLAMGSYFAIDTVNRPGFSELFFKAASEERQHAIKLIEYLLMRGQLTDESQTLSSEPALVNLNKISVGTAKWDSGVDALRAALDLETKVTESIRTLMEECEKSDAQTKKRNDFHLVDYLTTVYLEEQYHGQRDLAGKISTLGKMMSSHGALAEFLFDKKLLNGEV